MRKRENISDFSVLDKGAVVILMPQTFFAKDWLRNNLYLESWRDDDQIPIEKRLFLNEIRHDLEEGGMTLQAA